MYYDAWYTFGPPRVSTIACYVWDGVYHICPTTFIKRTTPHMRTDPLNSSFHSGTTPADRTAEICTVSQENRQIYHRNKCVRNSMNHLVQIQF